MAVTRFLGALYGCFVLSTLILSPGGAQAPPKEITRGQARQLVLTQLQSDGFDIQSPNLVVEDRPDDPDMPGFYQFGAYTTDGGSAGAYAVGHRTAELWNWMHCWRFSRAKNLRDLQNKLRKEIGLTESEYRKLSAKRPFCFSVPVTEK
jgi:hypothetical protein